MKLYRIKRSKIDKKGRGLYATRDIKEGTKIIEYKGKIISVKETEINPKFDNDKAIYLFNLNKKYDLDGLYIPSFNKLKNFKNINFKKNFKIIGSAHNIREIKIKEIHHIHKKDAPSGTAKTLANVCNYNYNDIESIKSVSSYLENRPELVDVGVEPKLIIDGRPQPTGVVKT